MLLGSLRTWLGGRQRPQHPALYIRQSRMTEMLAQSVPGKRVRLGIVELYHASTLPFAMLNTGDLSASSLSLHLDPNPVEGVWKEYYYKALLTSNPLCPRKPVKHYSSHRLRSL